MVSFNMILIIIVFYRRGKRLIYGSILGLDYNSIVIENNIKKVFDIIIL